MQFEPFEMILLGHGSKQTFVLFAVKMADLFWFESYVMVLTSEFDSRPGSFWISRTLSIKLNFVESFQIVVGCRWKWSTTFSGKNKVKITNCQIFWTINADDEFNSRSKVNTICCYNCNECFIELTFPNTWFKCYRLAYFTMR